MMLRGGGRLYLEMLVGRANDGFARDNHLRPLRLAPVVAALEARGGRVVSRKQAHVKGPGARTGHRIGRLVVEWQR
jgi:hypothetical protein